MNIAGATLTLRFTFATPDGTAFDPQTGTGLLYVREPGMALDEATAYPVEASGAVEHIATGVYDLTLEVDAGGRWRWRAEGINAGKKYVGEGAFNVAFSRVLRIGGS